VLYSRAAHRAIRERGVFLKEKPASKLAFLNPLIPVDLVKSIPTGTESPEYSGYPD
jgi:hypothetical protein